MSWMWDSKGVLIVSLEAMFLPFPDMRVEELCVCVEQRDSCTLLEDNTTCGG